MKTRMHITDDLLVCDWPAIRLLQKLPVCHVYKYTLNINLPILNFSQDNPMIMKTSEHEVQTKNNTPKIILLF